MEAATPQLHGENKKVKPGLGPRPVGGNEKLGTFSGVFVPTCLNVLSILMFLRFGFILGQAGVVGMMGMLIAAYAVDLITVFSLSAIASNGTVRGGGAYYLISRSLGPEFGGSIGLVFFLGQVFSTGMNAVALVQVIVANFGADSGNWSQSLPESPLWMYLWATIVLVICTAICLGGSGLFARASNGLLVVLLIATLSIPASALIVQPFESRKLGVQYTGLSLTTLKENMMPRFTKGAAGSQTKGKETFQDLFGILFPATSGIFAGASMSGDLKHPSKAIPKGTLWALVLTFVSYVLVILAMAATTTRASFIANVNVIQITNVSESLVFAGELATSFFSTLMGVIGSAKLLQALARDELFPGLKIFGQGTKIGDEPIYAIIMTYVGAQITMIFDINQIASFVTMAYLMTFLVMNLATFLLKIGSAPNFRPSFHFFNWQTAFAGSIVSGVAMFFVDGVYASACIALLILLFLLVHYTSKPKSWGDVSQSLIYHQVRKYLLRLKPEHVKFWRPQILLFVNDPRRQYKLIQFCNSMKKGSLYILGHVIINEDFASAVPEARKQQAAWSKYIDFSRIKAFVNISVSPQFEWGARNLALNAGLGGMRPNIAVLGFYNLKEMTLQRRASVIAAENAATGASNGKAEDDGGVRPDSALPTDTCKTEIVTSMKGYVSLLEDLLLQLQINVAVARGFSGLQLPHHEGGKSKKWIDLWPIQMSAEIAAEGPSKLNLLTTNFDTYTLILQLGCILNTVPSWKKSYKLRVCVFVEYESDVKEERHRVKALLQHLRIEAEILTFWLACGNLSTYEMIVNGKEVDAETHRLVEDTLKEEPWWDEVQAIRGNRAISPLDGDRFGPGDSPFSAWPDPSFQQGMTQGNAERFLGLRQHISKRLSRRKTIRVFNKVGVSLGMRAQRLPPQLGFEHTYGDESSSSSSSDDSDSDDQESLKAASEGDIESESSDDMPIPSPVKITRRRSHGDTLRGPPPSKRATGAKQPKTPGESKRASGSSTPLRSSLKEASTASPAASLKEASAKGGSGAATPPRQTDADPTVKKLEERFASLRQSPKIHQPKSPTTLRPGSAGNKPPIVRHASQAKFSSKPVPMARVAAEEGAGPSIMFVDTPSPPPHGKHRLPSAYNLPQRSHMPSFEIGENDGASSATPTSPTSPSIVHRGSTYSTQSVPLSFNDLPPRAQHLILNELMKRNSTDTAVLFTTLPTPPQGTCRDEEACYRYLSDLDVLGDGCPPMLMVHSNSMTVTMSL
jgi:potassium/chloride transporter 9